MDRFPVHFTFRVLLYAPAPLAALHALDKPGITVCDMVRNADDVIGHAARLQPHAVILYETPADLPSLTARIGQAAFTCPPEIIVRSQAGIPMDEAVLDMLRIPCPQLALDTMPARQARAKQLVRELGMEPSLLGTACVVRGAALLSAWPRPAPPLQYHLYPLLAKEQGASPASVEKRIRSAIESAWLHGDLSAQNKLLGLSVSAERGKPTNSELLFRLADQIVETLDTR